MSSFAVFLAGAFAALGFVLLALVLVLAHAGARVRAQRRARRRRGFLMGERGRSG